MATYQATDGSWIIQARFPKAQEVYLLGAFNNWSTTATRLRPVGQGLFETKVDLKAMQYEAVTGDSQETPKTSQPAE